MLHSCRQEVGSKVDLHWFIDDEHPLGTPLRQIGKRADE
jgi:hypothetical protein